MKEQRFGGRVYVEVDPILAESGDVLQYTNHGHRTHRVIGRRGGKRAAVKVQLHKHEDGVKWVPMHDVNSCWRRRTRMDKA